MKKNILSLTTTLFVVLFTATTVLAGDWVQEGEKYKYDKGNGSFAVDE